MLVNLINEFKTKFLYIGTKAKDSWQNFVNPNVKPNFCIYLLYYEDIYHTVHLINQNSLVLSILFTKLEVLIFKIRFHLLISTASHWENKTNNVVYKYIFTSFGILPHLYITMCGRQPLKWPPMIPSSWYSCLWVSLPPWVVYIYWFTTNKQNSRLPKNTKKQNKTKTWLPSLAYSSSLTLRKARCPCCELPMEWPRC